MSGTIVIMNPSAGGCTADCRLRLRQWASDRGDTTIVTTDTRQDVQRLAASASHHGATLVAVAGGDGTISDVIGALGDPGNGVALAIIPTGTGNDLARTLNIPRDLEGALAVIDAGHTQAVDLVEVDGLSRRWIINAASGGFARQVHQHLTRQNKRRFGPLAYVLAAAKAMRRLRFYRVTLDLDGAVLTARTPGVVIANGQFLGGGSRVAPTADLSDGKADVLVVTAKTFWEQIKLAWRFIFCAHLGSPNVEHRRAQRITITSRPAMTFYCDGDRAGKTPVTFTTHARRIRVMAPAPQDAPAEDKPAEAVAAEVATGEQAATPSG